MTHLSPIETLAAHGFDVVTIRRLHGGRGGEPGWSITATYQGHADRVLKGSTIGRGPTLEAALAALERQIHPAA